MLEKLRKQAAKILMSLLFGLLIMSFAIWGIGDIFRGSSQTTTVAEVGGAEIDARTFSQYLTRDINRLQTQFGARLEIDQIRALGIVERLLQELITGTLLDEQAYGMGMVISQDQMKQRIVAEPMFQDETGRFDRALFDQALQISNLSETAYVIGVERDLLREQLGTAASGAVRVSRRFVEDFYRYRDERRVAETITVPRGGGEAFPEPDDAALQAVLTSRADRFQTPEVRSLTLIELRAEDLLDEVRVSDEELQDEFDARRAEFAKPERRSLEQVLFDSEAEAATFKTALDGGREFAAAAEALELSPVVLAELSQAELSGQMADLAEAAFALQAGQVTEPIESPFGWHVVRVTEILPPYEAVFEDQREVLQAEIAERYAVDSLISLANQLDDELGAGAELEEAADSLGLAVTNLRDLDRTGATATTTATTTSAGERPDLPQSDDFLRDVFAAEIGETSLLSETPDGDYFVFRVDRATPPALRALDEVRTEVLDLWRQEEARQHALIQAEALADQVRLGSDMAGIASAEGLSLGRTAPIDRFGLDPEAAGSPDLTAKLFGLGVDEIAVAEVPDGWVVLKLAEVQPGDPVANAQAVEILADGLAQSLRNDVMAAFTQELDRNLGVSINQGAIDAVLSAY
jgi:peptidyl-prolyl cis-trans isomerase D